MSQVAVTIKQFTDRLQNATSSERLVALQELQGLARSEPAIVGECALQRVLDFLKEQGSTEEYQESLDLIDRLVKCRDRTAAAANTSIILSSVSNIELLLDLLEHQDLTVGVMTSQILTEVHANEPRVLELQIQECPAGMNKLLQRLPDSSREEVRNQAIVLVQQLTAQNEEMKKTVVFNEGFEIIFGIIRSEGGSTDAGHVVQDCLKICSNILHGSETCQRLFFGMGSDWIIRLSEFFNPSYLESIALSNTSATSRGARDDDGLGDDNGTWFEQPNRVLCAALCLKALAGSLQNVNPKHQKLIGETIASIVPSAAFWVLRKGPAALTDYSLLLLERIVDSNAVIAHHFSNTVVKASPANPGITIPTGIDLPTLTFGWRPHPSDDRRFVVLTSLLAERYIYSGASWRVRAGLSPEDEAAVAPSSEDDQVDTGSPDGLSQGCLRVLEKVLAADTSVCDMTVQHILAPPPPLMDEEEDDIRAGGLPSGGRGLESMRPLGSILLNTLVECTSRVLGGNSSSVGGHLASQNAANLRVDVDVAERAANLLGLVFIYGGQLARELSTVISTMHTSLAFGVGGGAAGPPQQILPYLLSTAGRAARIPGSGHQILVALLRLLSIIANSCDIAARQMLDDPSNFFVLELATPASEAAGVPAVVQVAACLFLGTCFKALVDPTPAGDQAPAENDNSRLSQRSLLGMIDGRIGLTRFTDLVKRPLLARGGGVPSEFFFSKGFRLFYEQTVESVRSGIFDFYAGGAGADDGPHKQVIEMQKEKIGELEERIRVLEGGAATAAAATSSTSAAVAGAAVPGDGSALQAAAERIAALEAALADKEQTLDGMAVSETAITAELENLRLRAEHAERELNNMQHQQAERTALLAASADEGDSVPRELVERYKEEIISLKQSVVELSDERQSLREAIEQRDRKIDLLEENLRGPVPYETNREKKIAELESRNAELKQQLWVAEDELAKATSKAGDDEASSPSEAIAVIELSVLDLVRSLGLHDSINVPVELVGDESGHIEADAFSLDDKVRALDSVLRQCADKISLAAGTCSDIAEGAGLTINDLRGEEGTLERLLSCTDGIAAKLVDAQDKVHESDNYRQQVEDAQLELEAADRLRVTHENEIARLEASVEAYINDAEALQAKIDQLTESLSAKTSDCDNLRAELNSIDRSSEASQRAAEQINSLEILVAELKQQLYEKEESSKQLVDELILLKEAAAANDATVIAATVAVPDGHERESEWAEKEQQLLSQISAMTAELQQKVEEVELFKSSVLQRDSVIDELEEKLKTAAASATASEPAAEEEDIIGADLLDQITTLKAELEAKNAEIDSLEQEIASQPAVVSSDDNSGEALRELQDQLASVNAQLRNKIVEIEALEGKLLVVEESSEVAQAALKEKASECEQLKKDLSHSRAQNEALEASLTEEREESERVVKGLGEKIQSMEDDMETQRLLINASVSNSVSGLSEDIHELKASYEARLQEAHNEVQAKANELTETLGRIEALEHSKETLTKSLQELGASAELQQAELETVTRNLRVSEENQAAEKQVLQAEVDRLQELVAASEQSAGRISELETSNGTLQEEIKESLEKLASLQAASDKMVADLQARIHGLEEELSKERSAIASERQAAREKEERDRILLENEPSKFVQAQLDMARQQLYALQTERVAEQQSFEKELQIAKDAVLTAEARAAKALEDMHASTKAAEADIAALQKSVSSLSGTIETLQTENTVLQQASREFEKTKRDLVAEIESLHRNQAATAESKVDVAPAEAPISARESKLEAEYQDAMERWNQEKTKLREIINALSAEVQQLKSQQHAAAASTAAASAHSHVHVHASSNNSVTGSPSVAPATPGPFDSPAPPRLPPSGSSGTAYQQQLEIRRLNAEAERLARELNAANVELHAALSAAAKREGEMAGMVFTFDTLREEVSSLRDENANLNRRLQNENKQVKELMREKDALQKSLRYEQEELQGIKDKLMNEKFKASTLVGHTISSVDFEVTQSTLVDIVKWLQSKIDKTHALIESGHGTTSSSLVPSVFDSPDRPNARGNEVTGSGGSAGADSGRKKLQSYRAADLINKNAAAALFSAPAEESKEGLNQLSLRELASRTKLAAETLVLAREREIAQQKLVLGEKEKELEEAKVRLRALSAAADHHRKEITQSGQLPPMTPAAHKSNAVERISMSPMVAGSPAARDVARLKMEVNRERRKLLDLQEEHSDLLCLLAQQEVELGVFRSALMKHAGALVVAVADKECERASIEKYGSYTNFRGADGTIGASP